MTELSQLSRCHCQDPWPVPHQLRHQPLASEHDPRPDAFIEVPIHALSCWAGMITP